MNNNLKITTAFSVNSFDLVSTNTVYGNGSIALGLTGSTNNGVSQSIAINWVRLPTGSVAPIRYMYLENWETSSLYTIDVGTLSGSVTSSVATLKAGDLMVLPPKSGSVWVAKSNYSASVLQIVQCPF